MDPALNQKAPSRALGCVFVPFFALGLFFVVMIVRQSIDSAATYTWQAVPCQIVESDVREASSPNPWFAYLRYSFSAGESLRSSRSFGAYREALLFTRRWPVGSSTTLLFWILAIRRPRCSSEITQDLFFCCSSRFPCYSYLSEPRDFTAWSFASSPKRASFIPAIPLPAADLAPYSCLFWVSSYSSGSRPGKSSCAMPLPRAFLAYSRSAKLCAAKFNGIAVPRAATASLQ